MLRPARRNAWAYRLDSQLEEIRSGARDRLNHPRAGLAVWQMAAKQAEFAHLVVDGYRKGYFTPVAALGITHMTPQESVAENLLTVQVEFLQRALGTSPTASGDQI
jgi:hypothetical protein